jgi:hypothetical protein
VGRHEQHRRGGDQAAAEIVDAPDVLADRRGHRCVVEVAQLLRVGE